MHRDLIQVGYGLVENELAGGIWCRQQKGMFWSGLLNTIDHLYTREIGRGQECFPEELLRLQVERKICSY